MAGILQERGRNIQFRPDTVLLPSSKKWHCMDLIFRRQIESFWYLRERLACLTMRNRVVSVGRSTQIYTYVRVAKVYREMIV